MIYNLDTHRIVDFKLKPWADRFLVLRAALYEGENQDAEDRSSESQGMCTDMTPTGFDITRLPSLNTAIQRVLDLLYAGIPRSTKPVIQKHISKSERNQQLRTRYAAGESLADLARNYDLSDQRVFQIIHHRQK